MTDPIVAALTAVTQALEASGIAYAVTGSFASSHHGYVRATEDIDIKVAAKSDRLEALRRHLPQRARSVDLTTWALAGDVLVELYPVRDDLDAYAVERRVAGVVEGRRVWVVPLEALLVLKVREHLKYPADLKHIDDIRKLLARNPDTLDVAELERLLALDPAWGEAWDELVEPA